MDEKSDGFNIYPHSNFTRHYTGFKHLPSRHSPVPVIIYNVTFDSIYLILVMYCRIQIFPLNSFYKISLEYHKEVRKIMWAGSVMLMNNKCLKILQRRLLT